MKLCFFDIDGTLWDEKRFIPESTKEAIKKLRKNGHKAFLCSGRARGNIVSDELFGIGFDGVLAACGNYIEYDGKIIRNNLLTDEQVKTIIEVTQKGNMPIVLEGPSTHWISEKGFDDDPYIDYLYEVLGDDARTLYRYEPGMKVNKFSADVKKDTDYDMIKDKILPFMDVIEHVGMVVEFVPRGTSKATGIAAMCNYLGVDVKDTFAFGDSINDRDMLEFAGCGICMGNGTDPAKEASDYITSSLWEDGIRNALTHFGLI